MGDDLMWILFRNHVLSRLDEMEVEYIPLAGPASWYGDGPDVDTVILGGGTLLHLAGNDYVEAITKRMSRGERVHVWGSGITPPEYGSNAEGIQAVQNIIEGAVCAGLRGKRSCQWAFLDEGIAVGDPIFLIESRATEEEMGGTLAINIGSAGDVDGGERAMLEQLGDGLKKRDEEHEFFSAWDTKDLPACQVVSRITGGSVREKPSNMELIRYIDSREAVISFRMHVFAACLALGTPVRAIKYHGKFDDLISLDGAPGGRHFWGEPDENVRSIVSEWDGTSPDFSGPAEEARKRLTKLSEEIAEEIAGS